MRRGQGVLLRGHLDLPRYIRGRHIQRYSQEAAAMRPEAASTVATFFETNTMVKVTQFS